LNEKRKKRIDKMAGYGQMMQQMKKMQREIEKKQVELDAREFNATSASGLVVVKARGNKEITEITIDEQLLTGDEREMIGDLVRLAVNTVLTEIETTSEEELGKITDGMNMPGMF